MTVVMLANVAAGTKSKSEFMKLFAALDKLHKLVYDLFKTSLCSRVSRVTSVIHVRGKRVGQQNTVHT